MRLLNASLTLAAIVLAVACGGRQKPAPSGGEDRRIRVHIEGNQSVEKDTLVSGLSMRRAIATGQRFDPFLVAVDEDRLRGFYLRRGHFAVDVDSEVAERSDQVDVTFRVTEGPRSVLRRVDMRGLPDDPHIDRDAIRDRIPIDDGDAFDYVLWEEVRPTLVHELQRSGYAHARMEAKIAADRVRHEAIVELEFEPGPVCHYGEVELVGVTGPLAEAARDRLSIKKGDRFSTVDLEEIQAALYDMGRFSVVRVEPDLTDGVPVVPVRIRVTPSDRHELRLGGGLGLDPASSDLHGRAGYTIAGWPGPLFTSRFELRPAIVLMRDDGDLEPRIEAIAGLERLDFLHPRVIGEAEASFAYLAIESYTSVGPRFRLGAKSQVLIPELTVSAGWQIRALEFREIDPAVDEMTALELGLRDDGIYRLGFFEQAVTVDFRDHAVEPRSGFYAEMRAEEGTLAAGGEFDYVRLTPEVRGYLPVTRRQVLAGRARYGAMIGDHPITQMYFGGGASSHRGFAERRLSPVATNIVDGEERSVPVGGASLLELSAEVRTPLGTIKKLDLGGVAFVDAGDVVEGPGDLSGNLHWAAGLGLRVATPIGPVRLDGGYRLNRADELRWYERVAFHLSLGEAF